MRFFQTKIFLVTVLLQLAGPFFMGFGDWANVIQYVSGFGMAYALWEYFAVHKPEIERIRERVAHLHDKHDELHKKHTSLLNSLQRFVEGDEIDA